MKITIIAQSNDLYKSWFLNVEIILPKWPHETFHPWHIVRVSSESCSQGTSPLVGMGNGPRYVRARTPIQTRGSEKLPDLRHSAEVVNSRPYVPTHDHLRTHILGRDRRDIFWKYVVVCRRRDAVIWSSINQCTQLINQAAAHRWRQTK